MVYGVLKLINFAHGDFLCAGVLCGLHGAGDGFRPGQFHFRALGRNRHRPPRWPPSAWPWSVWRSSGSPIVPIYASGRLPAVVSALGASIVIQNAIMVIWGPRFQAYPARLVPNLHLHLWGIHITLLQVVILVSAFILMGILYFLIQKTTFGAAVRASALDRDTASLMGINFNKVIFFVFTLGPALGAITGVMVGMYYRQINFTMGWNYGLKAFTATILGGNRQSAGSHVRRADPGLSWRCWAVHTFPLPGRMSLFF